MSRLGKLNAKTLTAANFETVIKTFDKSALPADLVDDIPDIIENIKLFYFDDPDDDIIGWVDGYINAMNEHLSKSNNSGGSDKKTETKPATKKATKTDTKPATKKAKKVREGEAVEDVALEVRMIKRWVLLDNKVKTREQILAFFASLKRAILTKKIRKVSKYADEITYIQNSLEKIYNGMIKNNSATVKLQLSETDKPVLEAYGKIAKSQYKRTSILLLSRFVGIHGKKNVKEKATTLLQAIKNAEKAGKIPGNDPYISELKKAKTYLETYIGEHSSILQISTADLKGLSGIPGLKCPFQLGEVSKDASPKSKEMIAEVQYRDGSNYKAQFVMLIPDKLLGKIKEGDENVDVSKFDIPHDEWEEIVEFEMNNKWGDDDHYSVEIIKIRPSTVEDIPQCANLELAGFKIKTGDKVYIKGGRSLFIGKSGIVEKYYPAQGKRSPASVSLTSRYWNGTKLFEADKVTEMLANRPKAMAGAGGNLAGLKYNRIIEYTDGFQWAVIRPELARQIFEFTNENVYRLYEDETESLIENIGEIYEDDDAVFAVELIDAIGKLKMTPSNINKAISRKQVERYVDEQKMLSGIEQKEPEIISSTELSQMDLKTMGFTGKWLSLIGDPSSPFSMMFWAKPGMGKSTLAIELCKYLATDFNKKVLFTSIEEGFNFTTKEKFERLDAIHPNISITKELPVDLSQFEVVAIDSVTRAKMTTDEFVAIKNRNPRITFILIFQATVDGNYRGSKEWEHEVDVSVYINENGYAAASKSRFGGQGTIKVFQGTLDKIYKFSNLQDAEKFVSNQKERLSMVQGSDGKVWVTNPDKAKELAKQGYSQF